MAIQVNNQTIQLGETSLTTHFDIEQEDFILTDEEIFSAIAHEVERVEKLFAWKLEDKKVVAKDEIKIRMYGFDISERINVVEILQRANSNKHYALWQQKQREEEVRLAEQKKVSIEKDWDANRFYKLIKWSSEVDYGKPLIVNDQTMQIIKPLCYFLSNDERFETELGYSLRKGIMFRGIAGLGKTHIVRCAANNERNPIFVVSMLEISDEVRLDGAYELPIGYSKFYLDDVGSEEAMVNNYGSRINWFKNFIELFYLKSQNYNRLIVSTNNTAQQIEERYGFRVRSRMKDMFNVIDLDGKDLRG